MRLSVLLLSLAGLLTPGLSCDGILYSGQCHQEVYTDACPGVGQRLFSRQGQSEAVCDCDVSEVTTATVEPPDSTVYNYLSRAGSNTEVPVTSTSPPHLTARGTTSWRSSTPGLATGAAYQTPVGRISPPSLTSKIVLQSSVCWLEVAVLSLSLIAQVRLELQPAGSLPSGGARPRPRPVWAPAPSGGQDADLLHSSGQVPHTTDHGPQSPPQSLTLSRTDCLDDSRSLFTGRGSCGNGKIWTRYLRKCVRLING